MCHHGHHFLRVLSSHIFPSSLLVILPGSSWCLSLFVFTQTPLQTPSTPGDFCHPHPMHTPLFLIYFKGLPSNRVASYKWGHKVAKDLKSFHFHITERGAGKPGEQLWVHLERWSGFGPHIISAWLWMCLLRAWQVSLDMFCLTVLSNTTRHCKCRTLRTRIWLILRIEGNLRNHLCTSSFLLYKAGKEKPVG